MFSIKFQGIANIPPSPGIVQPSLFPDDFSQLSAENKHQVMTSYSNRHQNFNQTRHQINKKQRHLRYEPYEMTHSHSPNRSFENMHRHHDVMSYESLRHRDYMTSPNMSLSSRNNEYHHVRQRSDPYQLKRTHRHNFNPNNQFRSHRKTSSFERNSYMPFSKVRIYTCV